jgi:hypothetical protein
MEKVLHGKVFNQSHMEWPKSEVSLSPPTLKPFEVCGRDGVSERSLNPALAAPLRGALDGRVPQDDSEANDLGLKTNRERERERFIRNNLHQVVKVHGTHSV